MKEIETILYPSEGNDLKNIKNKYDWDKTLVLVSKTSVFDYCLKNDLNFVQEIDLISKRDFELIDTNSILKKIKDNYCKNKINLNTDYQSVFNYQISNQIKTISYVNILKDCLIKKGFKGEFIFLNLKNPITFLRNGLFEFKQILLYLLLKKEGILVSGLSIILKIRLKLIGFLIKFLKSNLSLVIFFEVHFKNFFSNFFKRTVFKKYDIIFFSSGRDNIFHNIIAKNLSFKSLIIKASSNHDKNTRGVNNFDGSVDLWNLFSNINYNNFKLSKKSRVSSNYLFDLIFKNYNLKFDKKITNLITDYLYFRFNREIILINLFEKLITNINPKVVFSTSLLLPSIASKRLGIKSITQPEGLGIDFNPMSPCTGDYIFSNSQLVTDQLMKYSNIQGKKIVLTGAYYK